MDGDAPGTRAAPPADQPEARAWSTHAWVCMHATHAAMRDDARRTAPSVLHPPVEQLQVHVAQALVVHDFPVRGAQLRGLFVDINRCFVLPQQVQRAADLLEVGYVLWVQRCHLVEQLQGLLDFAWSFKHGVETRRRVQWPPKGKTP